MREREALLHLRCTMQRLLTCAHLREACSVFPPDRQCFCDAIRRVEREMGGVGGINDDVAGNVPGLNFGVLLSFYC